MAMGANDKQIGGDHYRSPIQHWDYVLANEIPYLEAQVIKYLTRWRKKGGHQDVKKAQHYLQKLFESEGIAWNTETDPVTNACQPENKHVPGCLCERCKTIGGQVQGYVLSTGDAGKALRFQNDPNVHRY